MTVQRNSGSQKTMKWYLWCAESKELPTFYSKFRNISLKNDKQKLRKCIISRLQKRKYKMGFFRQRKNSPNGSSEVREGIRATKKTRIW